MLSRITSAFCQLSLSLSLYFSLSDSASGFSLILTPISTEHRLSSHFLAACADIPSLLAHHIHVVIFFCTSSFLWLLILTRSRQLSIINDTESLARSCVIRPPTPLTKRLGSDSDTYLSASASASFLTFSVYRLLDALESLDFCVQRSLYIL